MAAVLVVLLCSVLVVGVPAARASGAAVQGVGPSPGLVCTDTCAGGGGCLNTSRPFTDLFVGSGVWRVSLQERFIWNNDCKVPTVDPTPPLCHVDYSNFGSVAIDTCTVWHPNSTTTEAKVGGTWTGAMAPFSWGFSLWRDCNDQGVCSWHDSTGDSGP